jgi:hypothetical protein
MDVENVIMFILLVESISAGQRLLAAKKYTGRTNMIYEKYSYNKLKENMKRCVTEILEVLNDKLMDNRYFREEVISLMQSYEPELSKLFEKQPWVLEVKEFEIEDEAGNKKELVAIRYEEYYEKILQNVMEEYSQENQDRVREIYEIVENDDEIDWNPSHIFLETFYTDDEIAEAKKEFRKLLKQYADMNGWSMLKASMQVPRSSTVMDRIAWLNDQIDPDIP